MGRRKWALRVGVALLVVVVLGWVISVARPTVFRVYGLGKRGPDGMYTLGVELGCYSAGLGVNVDRLGHTSGRWVAVQSYSSARHGADGLNWRWWPRVWRAYGPLAWWTEVFVPFWMLVAPVGGLVVWLSWRTRHRAGSCARCGYDLRGLAGACPECGAGRAG